MGMTIEEYYQANRVAVSTRASLFFGRCRCFESMPGHKCPVLFTDTIDRWSLAYLRMVFPKRRLGS